MNAHRMCRYPDRDNVVRDKHGIVPAEYWPLCKIKPPSEKGAMETARKLRRLKAWTDYFELETFIPEILEYLEGGGWRFGKATFKR